MASSVTLDRNLVAVGNKVMRYGTLNVGTYATSGVAVTNTQLGLNVIESFICQSYGGVVYEPVINAAKTSVTIKCYFDATPAAAAALPEATNGTDFSAHVVQFQALGR